MLVQRAKSLSATLLAVSRYNHAERVANLLSNPTEVELAAAYLHDILEDTRLEERVLLAVVGEEVTKIVKELTHAPINYLYRRRDYSSLKNASKEAKRIKLADRIDNIQKRFNWVNPTNNDDLISYVDESRELLSFVRDADEKLAKLLDFYIQDLLDKCLNSA